MKTKKIVVLFIVAFVLMSTNDVLCAMISVMCLGISVKLILENEVETWNDLKSVLERMFAKLGINVNVEEE